ncbi:hypothetical protein Agabi119p4_8453 [Agaricus bisporus var. burnettii]|uniref:Uncharacterized protein n=1 Tax=Agaricus bisporus var. burnettii TaxID=192524 RepID=A0A8H7C6N1_AGABI|nr:hypothetical protein Agabi119p4_8453 [Agaricus bisporus var. burnettii]
MSSSDVITAYPNAFPEKQTQPLPGIERQMRPGVDHSKLESWDEGKPSLKEYKGSGKLQGKTALITGGDSGIGRAAAIMFAREGCAGITISHLPEEQQDAKAVKPEIEEHSTKLNLVSCDLMEKKNCKDLVESHLQKFGKLDILVNNASKQIMCDKLENIDLGYVESTFQSNIIQMFAVTKFALPHLKRGSSIINTTSVVAATKGAIAAFTRSLALQLISKGIRVNAVAPGPVITPLQPASRTPEDMEGWGSGTPLHGRAAQPAELGPAYVFLASSDSNVMTGQVLHVNSGLHIGGS